jgi:hypothetical protein
MQQTRYSIEVERTMKKFFESLSEKDRRRYAAIEAMKMGHGGQKYICEVLGCDPDTVKKGNDELHGEIEEDARIRKAGAGAKKRLTQ